ncbi:XdhC family protein [Rhizobium sp. KVB221]|uniref:XdhC family protein n=1 Tax=Rhizobium setariae TaxID=2801340 RepID=A0A936YQM5_9HYPH|nr:XdhC family protein [Rhizobium setariae]MBL0372746.1 XdhC family protein [Rhizobium setariae]
MRIEHLVAVNEARRARRAVILLTDLESGEGRVFIEGGTIADDLRPEVEKAFRTGKSGTVEIGGKRLFLNVQVPPPRIAVIGAVHISQALASMAPIAGYDLRIIDPRTAFATPERFEGVDLAADWPEDVLAARPLDAYTALVAVTHDPKIDDYPIVSALKSGCFYVGALGSRKTHAKRIERLKEAGCSDEEIARIDAPIGLDIGAQSPAEIAVAVLGAIIQSFRRRALGG